MRKIVNGDKTIIISKQEFANRAVKACGAFVQAMGEESVAFVSLLLTCITTELFEVEDDEGFDEG